MKRQFSVENLDCANCARKMEDAIRRIEGVRDVRVNFLTQKITLDAEDERYDDICAQAAKACRKIEPDCRVRL